MSEETIQIRWYDARIKELPGRYVFLPDVQYIISAAIRNNHTFAEVRDFFERIAVKP